MACLAAALAFGFAAALFVGVPITRGSPDWLENFELLLIVGSTLIGMAVLTSWMTLIVGRRWRAEPTSVDRLGRAVGVFWIVAGVVVPGLFLYASG
jgi:hypothetical protein